MGPSAPTQCGSRFGTTSIAGKRFPHLNRIDFRAVLVSCNPANAPRPETDLMDQPPTGEGLLTRASNSPAQNGRGMSRDLRVAELHEEIIEHVEDAISLGERGILDAGNLLGAIVREALAHGEETSRLLADSNACSVMECLGTGARGAEAHLGLIDELMSELGVRSAEAIQATQSIAKTVDAFREVMLSTRMVGVSMRIEIAWLSNENELGVIPEQLRTLGDEIESLSTELEHLSASLRQVLPALAASSARVAHARNAVRVEVADSVSALGSLTGSMINTASESDDKRNAMTEQIRLHCEEALVQLQFFDPMVQDLRHIDVLVSEFRSRLSLRDGAPPVEPIRYGRRVGELSAALSPADEASPTVSAGELMFF